MTEMVMQLLTGERLCLDEGSAHTISLVNGMVWIAQGSCDAFLSAGDSYTLEPGTAVVQSMTDTRLIESPSQLASSATTESLFADHVDQFNLNDIGLAMRFTTSRSVS